MNSEFCHEALTAIVRSSITSLVDQTEEDASIAVHWRIPL